MGGFDVKPGNTTPEAFSRAHVKEHASSQRVTGYETGEDWIDHDAKCEDKQGQAGCFLSNKARGKLIANFQADVANAQKNYQIALVLLKVESMMEKDDDASWLIMLALDLAGAHLVSVIASSIKSVHSAGLARLSSVAGPGALTATPSAANAALDSVTSKNIDTYTKASFEPVKSAAKKLGKKAQNESAIEERGAVQSYIALLMDQCDEGFQNFALSVSANADDAELVVLWHGMHDRSKHSVSAYKTALAAKLDRFKKSGVREVGHGPARNEAGTDREKRVVYVRDARGHKVPWYSNADQSMFVDSALARDKYLERRVPEEFAEIAIARSEEIWGPTPTNDDGFSPAFRGDVKPSTVEEAAMAAFRHYTDPALSIFAGTANTPLYAPPSIFDPKRKP